MSIGSMTVRRSYAVQPAPIERGLKRVSLRIPDISLLRSAVQPAPIERGLKRDYQADAVKETYTVQPAPIERGLKQ